MDFPTSTMALEQFLVSWNNFHKNMNSGMNSLLENEDFVDVTLAVEGRHLKAHKMVLSVCSSYFRELFKTSQCKHPIVFMKDVSYSAMSDLLKFMYKGEVQVNEEDFNTFIKTAESLQIKGLSNYGNVSSQCGTESQPKTTKLINSEVLTTDNSTPQERQHTSPIRSPKRLRLDDQTIPIHDEIVKTEHTLEESTATTSFNSELMSLKTEPYDEEESSVGVADDDSNGNMFDDSLDEVKPIGTEDDWIKENTNVDENDDYWMTQGDDEVGIKETPLTGQASVTTSSLPEKSAARYEHEYAEFKKWQKENNVIGVTEEVLLSYINILSNKFSPNSLWSKWSMLKTCLEIRENIDVRRFYKVITFLKRRNERYVPKKAKTLTKEQVEKFILEAPDDKWLLAKVITIFGIFGCCRCDELLSLTLNDVEDLGKYIIVTLRDTKNSTTRRFTITDDGCSIKPCMIYRKYAALRPDKSNDLRLFLTYRNGKCVALNAGQHTVGNVPRKIAEYLGLEEPALYTGHSFRRTGATMVGDEGGDNLKRAGGWKSSTKRLFPLKESMPSTSTEYT